MAKLNVYMWDTDIGRFIAVAENISYARAQVMKELPPDDTGRNELAEAIRGKPQLLGDKTMAILAYER